MTLKDAEYLAFALMEYHGLHRDGWTFEFDRAKRRNGCCSWGDRKIYLSRYYVTLNDESLVRDTILHEIAHALTPVQRTRNGRGRWDHHGPAWKATAVRIGARPIRCKSADEVKSMPVAPGKYQVKCKHCGVEWRVRRLGRRLKSAKMGGRVWHLQCGPKGALEITENR